MYLSKFKTQKEATAYVRNLLVNTPYGISLNPEFEDILKHHPNYERKIGVGLKHFVISQDIYYHKCIVIHRTDDTFETFSWVICCKNSTPEQRYHYNLKDAMREAVNEQINEFRHQAILKCEFCNSTTNLEVDHIYLFSEMSKEFLKKNEAPTTFGKCPVTLRSTIEGDFRTKWEVYHKKHATLRILCKPCNIGRNKKV